MKRSLAVRSGLLCFSLLLLVRILLVPIESDSDAVEHHQEQPEHRDPTTLRELLGGRDTESPGADDTHDIISNTDDTWRGSVAVDSPSVIAAIEADNVVMTAFIASSKSSPFYHGRDVPSFDWVGAFVLSLFSVLDADTAAATKLVFFADNGTVQHLRAWHSGRLRGFETTRQLLFVTVFQPGDCPAHVTREASGAGAEGAAIDEIVCPTYLTEAWASNVNNAANNFRFALYRDWLAAWQTQQLRVQPSPKDVWASMLRRKVLFADNTDVAFQRNPFSSAFEGCFPKGWSDAPTVVFTAETKTFRSEKYNRRWFSCFGQTALDRLSKQRAVVSCAGLTFGNALGMLRYSAAQVRQLRRPSLVACSGTTVKAALDQASHNFLLHRAIAEAWPSLDSIATLATADGQLALPLDAPDSVDPAARRAGEAAIPGEFVRQLVTAENACVFHGNFGTLKLAAAGAGAGGADATAAVNSKGAAYAVVHQYTSNRHPPLMQLMRKRHGLPTG